MEPRTSATAVNSVLTIENFHLNRPLHNEFIVTPKRQLGARSSFPPNGLLELVNPLNRPSQLVPPTSPPCRSSPSEWPRPSARPAAVRKKLPKPNRPTTSFETSRPSEVPFPRSDRISKMPAGPERRIGSWALLPRSVIWVSISMACSPRVCGRIGPTTASIHHDPRFLRSDVLGLEV